MAETRKVFIVRKHTADDDIDLGFCDSYEEAVKQREIVEKMEMDKLGKLDNAYEILEIEALYHG